MSASEKLKALESAGWYAVLPQIVALVEAVEAVAHAKDDWDEYAKMPALDEALAALDEALET